ncbi:Hypp5552 [Branchiostoma lanceolatum]|uniref:Hypp5552 protein n=1 Tax=Branchiostoma lanceolatum TaxID=7740 RepID=A0A8J9VEC8_BRALA|nr:Hypp5552 [Branchiostoma lanceolatum]
MALYEITLLLLVSCILLLTNVASASTCEQTGPCTCRMSDGAGEIDLSALASSDSVLPAFQNVNSTGDDYVYSYNPCQPFTQGTCKDVSACQYVPKLKTYFPLGTQDSAKFIQEGQDLTLRYIAGQGSSKRETKVKLVCGAGETTFTAEGQDPNVINLYHFTLKSPCACPGGCSKPSNATCRQVGPCSCNMTDGSGMVDLHRVGRKDGPAFRDIMSPSEVADRYSYNPCYPFSLGSCRDAAACVSTQKHGVHMENSLGSQDKAAFFNTGSNLYIVYGTDRNDSKGLTSLVQLVCDRHRESFEAQGPNPQEKGQYLFTLRSPCACPGMCETPVTTPPAHTTVPPTPVTVPPPTPNTTQPAHAACVQYGTCACMFKNGSYIDLTSLEQTSGEPLFKDHPLSSPRRDDGFYYSFNPCAPFTEGKCEDVAVCKKNSLAGSEVSLGKQDSSTFATANENGPVAIMYASENRMSIVSLRCTEEKRDRLIVLGADPKVPNTYEFILESPQCCLHKGGTTAVRGSLIWIVCALTFLLVNGWR